MLTYQKGLDLQEFKELVIRGKSPSVLKSWKDFGYDGYKF
jgi:hypothetical protein